MNGVTASVDNYLVKGKKMLIIGTTKHLAAMRELELYEAFGKNAIKVPMITQVSEVMAVLAEQQDLFDEAELDRIKKHLRNDPSTNISIGVKEVVNECGILRSVDKDMRVDLLLLKLKASGDEIDY